MEAGNGQYILVQTAQQAGIRKLYHYQALEVKFFEDMLTKNRLHVSNIANVNDPWDCRPWFDKDVSDPVRRREWATFFEPLLELRSEKQREAIAKLNPPWKDNEGFLALTIDGLIASVVETNIQKWRIYCLTPDPASIMMWSHYADKHTGICLEFNTGGDSIARAQKVTYRDDFPIITPALLRNPTALTEIVLLTKSRHWSHEEEYRLLIRDRKLDPTFSVTCEDECLPLTVGTLTAVIAGAKCIGPQLDAIKALVKLHAPHVAVKRATSKPHKYEISISP